MVLYIKTFKRIFIYLVKKINYLIILILTVSLVILAASREFIYFRDYALIYDGAARIALGKTPYYDFGIPVGPITFLLSSAILVISNFSWESLYKAQLIFNIITLLFLKGIYDLLKINNILIQISLISFTFFYLIFQIHPWYNSTAVMFLFINQFFILYNKKYSINIAGATSALALLSKHDIGMLVIAVSIMQIININKDQILNKIINYILGFSLIIIILFYFYSIENMMYWINIGQHGPSRNPLQNQPSILFVISILSIIYGLYKNINMYIICGSIVFISSISINTSGLYFTHFYFVGGLIPILFNNLKLNITIKSICSITILLYLIKSILISNFFLMENFIKKSPEHYLFGSKYITKELKIINMEECSYKLKNVFAPKDTCNLINDIQSLNENNIIPRNGIILNLSELRVINTMFKYEIPVGHPLWYDKDISLYPNETIAIKKQIYSGIFDIIILQPDEINLEKDGLLSDLMNSDVRFLYSIKKYTSPTDLTDCSFKEQCPKNIWLLYKNNLNGSKL
jgi:hypothetical protein